MAPKDTKQIDILVSDQSIARADRLTKGFKDAGEKVDKMLLSLQALDKALEAFKGKQVFSSKRGALNFMEGAANQVDVGVRRTAAGSEARNLSLANQLLRAEKEREAIELSRSRRLTNNAAQIARINTLEEANLKVRAAELRLGDALGSRDNRRIENARQLLKNLEDRRKAIVETQRAEEAALKAAKEAAVIAERSRKEAERRAEAARREADATARRNAIEEKMIQRNVSRETERRAIAAERAAKAAEKEAAALEKQRMRPITDRVNAQRSRELTEMRLFGDGGASLLKIQTGLMANYAMINAVSTAFGMAVRESVAFDASLRNLQAIVQVSDGSLEQLKGQLIEVANESKYTANEVAQAAVILGQAGFSSAQIEASVGAVMKLATATGTDLVRAVDIATSVLGIFNMEAGKMEHVANALTQAMNSSKLDIEKLTLGIQYAGNTAFDAGVGFEELTAGLGAMANAGIRSGSTLGTGMRQILVSLEKPSETFQKNLGKLGLSMNDVNLKTKGLYQVMKTLKDAGFSAADAIESFEVRSAAAFIALSNNLPLMESMETTLYRTAAASEASATQMRSLDAQFKRFSGALSTVVYQAIEPMIYGLRDVVKTLGDFLSALSGSPDALRTWGVAIGSLIAGFAGYKVIGLFVGLLKLVPVGLTTLTGATTAATVSNSTFVLSLQAIQTNLIAASIGLRSAAAGTVGLGTAMTALGLGVRAVASTIGLLAPILAAATLAYYAFSAATSSYTAEVGKQGEAVNLWKSRVEAARGVTDSFKAKIGELETKIKSLYGRYNELNKSQETLRTEIGRVRTQFSGMNSTVNGTESSVDDLIAKLGQLWLALQKQYILRIGIEIQNLEGLLAVQQTQFNTALTDFNTRIADFSTGDAVADQAIADYRNAPDDMARDDARKRFDNRVNELSNLPNTGEVSQMAEADIRRQFNIPDNVSLADGLAAKGMVPGDIVPLREAQIKDDIAAQVEKGLSIQGDLLKLGESELGILQTQDALRQRGEAKVVADARVEAKPLMDAAQKTKIQVSRVLDENANKLKNDPQGLYQANKQYEEQLRPVILDQIRTIEASDMPDEVKTDIISGLNETLGLFGVVNTDQFEASRQVSDTLAKRVSVNTTKEFNNAVGDVRTSNTEADVPAAVAAATAKAKQRAKEAELALKAQIPPGQTISDPQWADQVFEIDRALEADLAVIEDARRETVENIRSGMGGANAAAKKDFNEFMDKLSTDDTATKSSLDVGGLSKDAAISRLDTNVRTAGSRLDAVTTLVDRMTPLARADQLSPEDQATYKRLVSEQDQLRNYISSTGDDIFNLMNDKEATYGFNTARRQDFEGAINDYENQLQNIDNQVTLKQMTPEAALTARQGVGTQVRGRLNALQTELSPLRAKVDSGVGLTAQEDAVFRQGVSEENRLVDLIRRTSDVAAAGGGGGGGGGDTPFDILMKSLEGRMGDADRGLAMKTMSGEQAVGQMQGTLELARQELATRQSTLATMTEGSKEYNALKEEERALIDLIIDGEERIKVLKEEQGLLQLDLLESTKNWAKENLNIGQALEDGFLNVLSSMKSGLSTLFSDLMSGTKSAKEAFRDFAMSVIESIQNVIAEMLAMYVMKQILGLFGMTMTGGTGPQIVPISSMTGGAVRKATGGAVEGNMARDSKLHMLMPGEYVLRKSAAEMIGTDNLDAINAMGNSAISKSEHKGVAKEKERAPAFTNVYVVSPDQQPVPGPADIIAVINDDIARGGSTKRLIKTVAMGY